MGIQNRGLGALAVGLVTLAGCAVEYERAPDSGVREFELPEPSGFTFTCEQLDFDGSENLDFDDFLILSELFDTGLETPSGIHVDFDTFLEFSNRYGETCDYELHAPLLYEDVDIDAAAIPTIFEQLDAEGIELTDEQWEQAFDEEGLFGIAEELPVMHPGDVMEVGETTLDDVAAYAARYNENGVAYQLRRFEGLVRNRMYMPGDEVHEELRDVYRRVSRGEPLPSREQPPEPTTCRISCGVTLWKQPRVFDTVAGRTCSNGFATTAPEVDARCQAVDVDDFHEDGASVAYARTSCVRDAMAGLHCVYSPGCRRPQHCEADLGTHSGETVKNSALNDNGAKFQTEPNAQGYADGEAMALVLPVRMPKVEGTPRPVYGRSEARDVSCDMLHEVKEFLWSALNRVARPLLADGFDGLGLPSWTIDSAMGYAISLIDVPEDTDQCAGTRSGDTLASFLASRSTDMPLPCGAGDTCEKGFVCVNAGAAYKECIEDPAEVQPERRYQPLWPTRRSEPLVTMRAQSRARAFTAIPADDGEVIDVGASARSHAAARANFWLKDLQAVGAGTTCSHWAPGDQRYDSLYDRPVYHRGVYVKCTSELRPGTEAGKPSLEEACQIDPNRAPEGCDEVWERPGQ